MKSLFFTIALFLSGILTAFSQSTFTAALSGENETHLVTTTATGMIEATLDGNILTVTGSFSGLSSPVATEIAGGAHIHMALAGQDGGVVLALDASLDSDMLGGEFLSADNTFELEAEVAQALMDRMLYVNIHTANFQSGELRGQLVPEADQVFRVNLSGSNEVPPVATMASGALVAELNDHTLTLSGSFSGLGSPVAVEIAGGAHLHLGLTGQNGEVAHVLNATLNEDMMGGVFLSSDNEIELTHDQLMALVNRGVYVNIHSENIQSGELRGQVLAQFEANFFATLTGVDETHTVNTMATGMVVADVHNGMITFTGGFSGLSSPVATEIAGGAHVHTAISGRDGGIALSLDATLTNDGLSGIFERNNNTFELTAELEEALFNRELYINIHSQNFQAGELRGQILASSNTFLTANLDSRNGADSNGPVQSDATGKIKAELSGNQLIISGSFNNLESPLATEIAGGAHIHTGAAGSTGGVLFVLNAETSEDLRSGVFKPENNTFTFDSETDIESLFANGLYVNVHSQMFQSGEIRGQLLTGIQFFADAPEIISPEDGAMIELMGSLDDEFVVTWTETEEASGADVVYLWELALDADFEQTALFANAGMDAMFSTTFGTFDDLLADAGVLIGETITLYHRPYSSNGSTVTEGEPSSVMVTRGTVTNIDENPFDRPVATKLNQNYPNPFNPTTQIQFSIADAGLTTLEVYNVLGQRVATLVNRELSAGTHQVSFDALNLSSGTYLYRLTSNNISYTRKMMLIK